MYSLLFPIAAAMIVCLNLVVCTNVHAEPAAPVTIELWPDGAPGALGKDAADRPTLTLYQPPADKASGACVMVCPGGGYGGLAGHEGEPIARWLNSIGVAGAVLHYRLGPRYHHPIMLGDAARGIRTIRSHAADWSIDPHRIGVIGFSAGGHLASTIETHFDAGDANAADPIDRLSSRPDLGILIYAVVTLTMPFTHTGSRDNLLGPNASPELIDLLSNEKQVTADTPPTFLVCSDRDTAVPCENSLQFALALRRAHVPVELHLFEPGAHGFGLAVNDPVLGVWPALCETWLKGLGFVKK